MIRLVRADRPVLVGRGGFEGSPDEGVAELGYEAWRFRVGRDVRSDRAG